MILLAYALYLGPSHWPVSVSLAYLMLAESAFEAIGLWSIVIVGTVRKVLK